MQTIAYGTDDPEIAGEKEQIGKNPGGRIGQACTGKLELGNQEKSYRRSCDHFKHAGDHGDLGIPHALDGKTEYIDEHQRDVEHAVEPDILNSHAHDFRLSGCIHKQREKRGPENKDYQEGKQTVYGTDDAGGANAFLDAHDFSCAHVLSCMRSHPSQPAAS